MLFIDVVVHRWTKSETTKNRLEKQIEETLYGWANYGGPRMQK